MVQSPDGHKVEGRITRLAVNVFTLRGALDACVWRDPYQVGAMEKNRTVAKTWTRRLPLRHLARDVEPRADCKCKARETV